MTAEVHRIRRGIPPRTPAGIRRALVGTDRTAFERDYQVAVARAAEDYDLAPLQDALERWWRVAVLSADTGTERRMLDTAAALRAGRQVPHTSWDFLRGDLGV